VAEELFLDWHTVKELDKQYMREQLRRAGSPAPQGIGIDEIAIAEGHQYRIVVSDLERGRPIWFGGKDRSEASMDEFFSWLGPEKCRRIRLVVVDMWKAFHMSTTTRRIRRHFSGPSQEKNSSMLASERSLPPNQMGRPRSRSLTTMRYWCPLAMAISSMPIPWGAGLPARRSCSRMYCLSSSLTVC